MYKTVFLLVGSLALQDSSSEYDRREWGGWRDADRDCQDTRQEVLIAESRVPVTFKTDKNCKVLEGRWEDPYTGTVFTNPRKLDVDHMVPLRHAHQSGGALWSKVTKRLYSNDLTNPAHLIAVSASANRSKGAKPPNKWLPLNPHYRCMYLDNWIDVKLEWNLTQTDVESWALNYMHKICEDGGVPTLTQ